MYQTERIQYQIVEVRELCISIRDRKKYKNRNSDSIRFDSIRFTPYSTRFDSAYFLKSIIRFDSIRLTLYSVRFDSIRRIHNRISYFLLSVVLIMCACKNGCLFLPRAHSSLVLEFISHRIIIVPMKISTTKKRINTQILSEIPFV